MKPFLMPSLGADMEDGIMVEQLVEPGSPVKRGDIIAAVETQKGTIEIEVFEDGILDSWTVPLGRKVPVGTPIAMIRASDIPDPPSEPEIQEPADPIQQPEGPEIQPPPPENAPPIEPEIVPPASNLSPRRPERTRQRVTPAARRRAAQAAIDLRSFGTEKIISLRDLSPLEELDETTPMSAMRQAISDAMSRSKREIPHYYLSDTIDLTAAEEFVAVQNAERPPDQRLVAGVLFLRAIARAVKKYPEFNGHFTDGQFVPADAPHVGMAINLRGGGLVAPAIHDTDTGSLDHLMVRLRDLVERVRQGRFRARELSDPTITLTSLGERGVAGITGVIFPPQVAIIVIGTPSWQPAVLDGGVIARRSATITLAADHRVSDGHRGARFLRNIISQLQTPDTL
ncbi:2-oxo acid dehydrogenase subunit E2 [Sulfitobacter sp. S223]|uniref:dihydrolipoamide acetyltransferase family protein n=1 Tax=Sulfitobacter sp. S223 TaxID=2867023 RepID=UPI0021A46F78|nr:dihydrolipoamide acetyltransferase family protein [Sulfitobacter sp. S223]UWR26736.1 2-oxo acid dehydrogenase subunit E2 [Sulfitobacter sp. S223]